MNNNRNNLNNPIVASSVAFAHGYIEGTYSSSQSQDRSIYGSLIHSTSVFLLGLHCTTKMTKKMYTTVPYTVGYLAGFATFFMVTTYGNDADHSVCPVEENTCSVPMGLQNN